MVKSSLIHEFYLNLHKLYIISIIHERPRVYREGAHPAARERRDEWARPPWPIPHSIWSGPHCHTEQACPETVEGSNVW